MGISRSPSPGGIKPNLAIQSNLFRATYPNLTIQINSFAFSYYQTRVHLPNQCTLRLHSIFVNKLQSLLQFLKLQLLPEIIRDRDKHAHTTRIAKPT